MSLTASISLLTLMQAGTPASVGVAPTELVLGIDQTVRITATVVDSEGQEIEFALRWFSADPTVATVDGNGRVTGVGEGQTRVVAAAGEVPGIVRVMVTDDRPFAIDVQGPSTRDRGSNSPTRPPNSRSRRATRLPCLPPVS
jgi:hypothetical protein